MKIDIDSMIVGILVGMWVVALVCVWGLIKELPSSLFKKRKKKNWDDVTFSKLKKK
jgi:hypothetical protein